MTTPRRRSTDRPPSASVIGAIVALVALVAATVIGLAIAGTGPADSTPLITALLGFASPALIALLTLLKAEKVEHKVDALGAAIGANGHNNGGET